MERIPGLLLAALLGSSSIDAQQLLLPEHVALRSAAARELTAAMTADATSAPDPDRLLRAIADALRILPAGSRASARLAAARDAARLRADPAAARAALRSAVGDLLADLEFTPLRQADLPAGFPGFQAVDEIELRDYPAYRMVRTGMRGGSSAAFWPLFTHIERNAIAMTTPVQMDWRTGPDAARPQTMAFLYGAPELGKPGVDGNVEVVDVPAMTVLSIGAVGDDTRDRVAALRDLLQAWVQGNPGWEVAGAMRTMGYNSPMVARDRRYFEVQLPIRRRTV